MKSHIALLCTLCFLILASLARAISEADYANQYADTVLPFLQSGDRFHFQSADGKYSLSAARFIHPHERGLIVVINGRSESWLKYGELFYDLYQKRYSIISYDHRGQGLSPHLVPAHPQIGYVDHFIDYTADLNEFMEKVVKKLHPESRGLFLIASSMGGAVAAEYLELHSSPPPFEAVVLSAPMFAINTKPYPEYIAHGIVTTLSTLGFGRHYAIGQHDCNPKQPFEGNRITGSRARWAAYTKVGRDHPEILIGGASNRWVETSLNETSRIRKEISKITTRVLILEAGDDDFVLNKPLSAAASQMRNGRLVAFPDSQHGILLESDPIRNKALGAIERFFERRKGAD